MKNLSFGLFLMVLFSCSNNDKTTTTTESAPNTPNVENVNGNVPDTASSVELGHSMAQDSSNLKDSTKK